MFQCTYCDKEFKYESEKKRHEQSHIPQFECKECCKKFSFLSALKRHQKQHERTCTVVCNTCGRNFRDDTLLKRHLKYAHNDVQVCCKCSAKFNSEMALSAHMKSHKPKSERRFKCSYNGCNKSFNFTHHLKHHELTHTNEKQHTCKICGKGFIQLHHLKTHLKYHRPSEWFDCTFSHCNKKFPTKYARNRHLLTHKSSDDSGMSSDSNCNFIPEPFKDSLLCTACGKMILLSMYEIHKEKCILKEEKPTDLSLKLLPNVELNNNNTFEPEFSTCKTILGRCIVSEDSTDNDCLCAQIKTDVDFYDSLVTSPIEPLNSENESTGTLVHNGVPDGMCQNCDCSSISAASKGCNIKSTNLSVHAEKSDIPKIEYRNDGVIKIKDTFDIEILDFRSVKKEEKVDDTLELFKIKNSFVPYNSCKAVLGKCIVSGNGTISEECLCAKMAMDDQTIIAQEIDEITPQPIMTADNDFNL